MSSSSHSWIKPLTLGCALLAAAACGDAASSLEDPGLGAGDGAVTGAGPGAAQPPAAGAAGAGAPAAADASTQTGAGAGQAQGSPGAADSDAAGGEDTPADAPPAPAGDDASALDPGDDTAAGDGAPGALPRPPCLKDPNQVVLLGDSYINWVSHTFPADLFAEAGQTFRNYAVGGYSMGSGGIGFIPPQLDQAIAEDPDITTIVMTGGGNDILVPDTAMFPRGGDCKMTATAPTIPDCQAIVDRALEAADEMMTGGIGDLAVETAHVVYFFYPNVPNGTLVGGLEPNAILDYAAPLVQEFCETTFERSGGRVACHFVDLRPVFQGHPEYFAPTDIHPSIAGSAAMAEAIWGAMQDACLAQPESSGCCEP